MLTNAGITIFHKVYNAEARIYAFVPTYYPAASWHCDTSIRVLEDGVKSANVIKIRIPTDGDVDIANGDKVCLGDAQILPDEAYIVTGYSDNRRGSPSMWHWRVVCA